MQRSGLQSVFLMVGLIVASCECILTCTSEPFRAAPSRSQSTTDIPPPCHGHNSSEHGKVPQKCAHSPVVAEESAPTASSSFMAVVPLDALAVGETAAFVLSDARQLEFEKITSPLSSPKFVLASVLRV